MDVILKRNGRSEVLVPMLKPVNLLEEMDRFAGEMWGGAWRPFGINAGLVPHTDIYEEKGNLVLTTELPGVDRKDVDISLEGGRLTILAEKKEEAKENVMHHTRERYHGRYFRSIELPYPVNQEKVEATFEKGVLELRLPKAEEAKARKIEIKAVLPEGETKKA